MIINIGRLQLRFYATIREKREGACSQIYSKDDKHILLWDFDEVNLNTITGSLSMLQQWYHLPTIYIISSSPDNYHAYCFTAKTFREVIHILSATPEIDIKYLRLGMARGYYTLRITPRLNDNFKLERELKSHRPNEVNPLDVTINEYLTSNKGS